MRTIILAGGFATRLWPLTRDRPKPLLPVAGRPIIEYLLERLAQDRPILSTNRRFVQQFEEWGKNSSYDVELVVEETRSEEEKLGSIGAIAYLIEKLDLDEDLLVIGGDNIFDFDLGEFISAYHGRPLLALYDIGDRDKVRERYGVALVKGNKIIGFQEKPEDPRSTLVSTACYIYSPEVLPLIRRFSSQAEQGKDAPGFFNQWLLGEGVGLDGFVFSGRWHDVGDRASYIQANMDLLGDEVYRGEDVVITNSAVQRSVIFNDVRIEGSVITDCVIDRGCELRNVELRECLVGAGTQISRG